MTYRMTLSGYFLSESAAPKRSALSMTKLKQESRAISWRTARCRGKFRRYT